MTQYVSQSWRDWLLAKAPRFLQDSWWALWLSCKGHVADVCHQMVWEASTARSLARDDLPHDAITAVGDEKRMPKYIRESWDSYRMRLQSRADDAQWDGTPRAITTELARAGYPNSSVVFNLSGSAAHTATPVAQAMEYPPSSEYWSQFMVFVPLLPEYDEGQALNHPLWDSNSPTLTYDMAGLEWSADQSISLSNVYLEEIRRIIDDHKAADWICREIVFVTPGGTDMYLLYVAAGVTETFIDDYPGAVERLWGWYKAYS